MSDAKFIIIEGGDCSGKTSFVRFVREAGLFPELAFTNEPGGNSYGMKIRHLLLYDEDAEVSDNLTKFHLYWASKAENFRRVIQPNLQKSITVVSDRFEGSTYAYQVSEDSELEDLFWRTREFCLQGVAPIYLYFDASVETQIARANARSAERNFFDLRGIEYRKKIDAAYRRFFQDNRIHSYRIDSNVSKDQMIGSALTVFKQVCGL